MAICRTPLGDDKIFVTQMEWWERMSTCTRCTVSLLSEDHAIDFTKLIGKPLSIEVAFAAGKPRFFHGIVARLAQGPPEGKFTSYMATVVPSLWFLTRRKNCRIFQEQSVPEIVNKILDEHDVTNVDPRYKAGDYLPWNYCVQYRETDFQFVSRLLEEEGIYYSFKYEKDRHLLVMGDLPSHHDDCAQAEIRMRPTDGGGRDKLWITNWQKEQELQPGKYALTDYNFLDPSTKLLVNATTTIEIGGNDRFEVFDYPGRFVNVGAETDGKIERGERWVKIRMQEEAAKAVEFRGRSEAPHITPGTKFQLKEHSVDGFNGKYLITGATHKLTQSSEFLSGRGGQSTYENGFTCIPFATPFRPPRSTPKPIVQGPQTAVVVGGEEIQIDDHARVRVLFHWDREGTKDGDSSCWIRVAENWAGKGWGTQFHPRVGQEVVVDFLEGDPDRPLIVGRLYNAEQTIHLSSPTQSGIMSRSSADGGVDDFNQIRFEDDYGREQMYIHAQKDQDIVVEANQKSDIGKNQSTTVGENQNITVEGNRSETITGNRSLTVEGGKSESVTGAKTIAVGEHSEDVGGKMTLTVKTDRKMSVGQTLKEDVGDSKTLSVTNDMKTTVGKTETLTVSDSRTVNVSKTNKMTVKENYKLEAKGVAIEGKDEIILKSGNASISLKKNGDIVIKGKKIEIKADGDVIVKGSKIGQN
jgi:type VI secretion system secreted protein VgrG